jgi:hypothetical protein
MATQRKKKSTRTLRSEKAQPDHAHVRPDRNLVVTHDGGRFFLAGTDSSNVVTIRPDGGIVIGNK